MSIDRMPSSGEYRGSHAYTGPYDNRPKANLKKMPPLTSEVQEALTSPAIPIDRVIEVFEAQPTAEVPSTPKVPPADHD